MNSERVFEWQLGNWLGLSPVLCWMLLVVAAAGGIVTMVWFYRHTLRALTSRQRIVFVTLRSGFFLALLLCLAGPSRTERVYDSTQNTRPLAVLIDRSASMTVPDPRGVTRLSSALRVWKKTEADALHSFPVIRYFRFSETVEAASDLEDAARGSQPGAGTHLFAALGEVMKGAPAGGYGGIVCLTDGLDTTETSPDPSAVSALQNHSPLYFCVGQGYSAPHESLLVRELDVPGQVLRKSQFGVRVIVEAHSLQARDVPISLLLENQPIASVKLHLSPGANLIPWTVPVNSAEPGLIHLECRLGEGTEQDSIAAAVRVVAQEQIHILFYQGSLDWSYRFINLALQNDPTFSITGLLSPELSLTQQAAPMTPGAALTQMPDKPEDLQPYQVVILANISANQMSPLQQAAVAKYVQGGGGVLFLVSDTKMGATFSGTELESMMPVIFESPQKSPTVGDSEKDFQEQMSHTSGSNHDMEGDFAEEAQASTGLEPLKFFAFPSTPQHSEVANLLGAASGGLLQNLPQFATYARVHGIKAGGEVVAIHPDDKTDSGASRALLVTQRFGQGHVTALLTDGLWRWKLSLPSTSHDPEVFWQQLFRTLARQQDAHGNLHFAVQPFFASLGQLANFRLEGAQGSNPPTVTALSPSGVSQTVPVKTDEQGDGWTFQVKVGEPGKWRIHVEDGRGAQMETWVRVSTASHGDELSGLPPDTDGLRKLAMSTGGNLLDDGVPDNWSSAPVANLTTLVTKRSEPLWDNWMLLLIGLGFYAAELIWRRCAKLL